MLSHRLLALIFVLSLPSAFAAHDWDWTGAESSQWSVKNNWSTTSGDATPQAGDTIRLRNATHLPSQQNIPSLSINKLIIGNNCPDFTVSGSAITLNKGGVDVEAGAGAVTLATPIILADQQYWTVPTGHSLTVTGSLTASGMTISLNGTANTSNPTINGISSTATPDFADYLVPGLPVEAPLLVKTWIVSVSGNSAVLTRPALLNSPIPFSVAKAWLVSGGGTLDLSAANGSAMNLPLIVYSGSVKFGTVTELKGGVVLDRTAQLELAAGSGPIPLAKPLVSLSALAGGNTETESATIRVSAGDVLTIPAAPGMAIGITILGQAGGVPNVFRCVGGGRVEFIAPSVPELSAASLRLESGSFGLNTLPYFPTVAGSFDPGLIQALGTSALQVRANAGVATTASDGSVTPVVTPATALAQAYGYRQLSVVDGTLDVNIESGALFQTVRSPASNYVFVAGTAALNVNGADDTALFRITRAAGSNSLSTTLNTGRFNLRGGQFYIHEAPAGAPYRIFPSQAGFTLALNGGVFNGNYVDSFLGNLVINDAPNGSPRIDNLDLSGSGDSFWGSGVLEKISVASVANGHRSEHRNHVLSFERSGGTVTVQPNAKLKISSGVVEARGTKNVFANDASTAFVDVENNARFHVLNNAVSMGSLSGSVASAEVELTIATLTVVNGSDTTYAGRFLGSGPLVKSGAGTLRLSGDNSDYSGAVSVTQGTLRADHALSSTGSQNVTVGAAGTLAGVGRVQGDVNVSGTIAPGSAPFSAGDNTLQTGTLAIQTGSSLFFTLIAPSSTDDCELEIAGDVSIQSGSVSIQNGGSFGLGSYRLMKYSGTLTGDVAQLTVVAMPAGFAGKIVHDSANKEVLLVSLTPPTSAIATPAQQNFRAATWPGQFAGTVAVTAGQTLASVEFSLREGAGNYWNGTAFGSATEQWHPVSFSATTWSQTFALSQFANDGTYTLRIKAADVFANVENPPASRTFMIDRQAPVVTVNALSTSVPSPALSGTINEPHATISVTLQGETRTAQNLGNGNWTLAAGQFTARVAGVYDVSVQATDPAGNVGSDASSNELTITLPDISIAGALSPQTGSANGGTVVTINGTNLELVTAVSFDGLTAAIQSKTSTTLTVTTPEHDAGTVTVVVQSLSNTVTLPAAFSYFNPPPGITSISPTRVSTNGGTVITITGSGFLAGAVVQVQGKNATNVERVSRSIVRAQVPENPPGFAAVTVLNPDFQAVSLPNAIVYDRPPQLTRALQISTSSILAGVPVQLLFTLLEPDNQPLTFSIDWGDGSPRDPNINHTFATAGNYVVTLFASDGVSEVAFTLNVTVASGPDNGGGGGGGPPEEPTGEAMIVESLAAAARFDLAGKDTWQVKGIFPTIPKNTNFEGGVCTLSVGGAIETFVLTAKGKAKSASGSLTLKLKFLRDKTTKVSSFVGGTVPFSAKVKGTFSDDWQDEGVTATANGKNLPTPFVVTMTLAGREFSLPINATMQAKLGKSAKVSFRLGR